MLTSEGVSPSVLTSRLAKPGAVLTRGDEDAACFPTTYPT
jgi:hypothetical protein